EALSFAGLLERFARPPKVAERLRGPEQGAGEPGVVMRAAQRGNRVAVMGECALVITAKAMQQATQEDDGGKPLLGAWREAVEPALQRRGLAALEGPLAVVANDLRRAVVIAGLLEVMDGAIGVSAGQRALGMRAMQLDDLRRGEQLAGAGAQELRDERLAAM